MCLAVAVAEASPRVLKTLPLDERTVYTVTVATDAPTTVVLPEPPTALEGTGLVAEPTADGDVLMAHRDGTSFLTFRALKPDAQACLNLLVGERVFALTLVGGEVADRVVRLVPGTGAKDLIALARGCLAVGRGGVAVQFERASPGTVVPHAGFDAVVAEVIGFDREGALVFRVVLENRTEREIRYDAGNLAVRCGAEVLFAERTDASGSIPANGKTEAWLVVRTERTVHENWSVLIPPAR